jgi:hypothetical protein
VIKTVQTASTHRVLTGGLASAVTAITMLRGVILSVGVLVALDLCVGASSAAVRSANGLDLVAVVSGQSVSASADIGDLVTRESTPTNQGCGQPWGASVTDRVGWLKCAVTLGNDVCAGTAVGYDVTACANVSPPPPCTIVY